MLTMIDTNLGYLVRDARCDLKSRRLELRNFVLAPSKAIADCGERSRHRHFQTLHLLHITPVTARAATTPTPPAIHTPLSLSRPNAPLIPPSPSFTAGSADDGTIAASASCTKSSEILFQVTLTWSGAGKRSEVVYSEGCSGVRWVERSRSALRATKIDGMLSRWGWAFYTGNESVAMSWQGRLGRRLDAGDLPGAQREMQTSRDPRNHMCTRSDPRSPPAVDSTAGMELGSHALLTLHRTVPSDQCTEHGMSVRTEVIR